MIGRRIVGGHAEIAGQWAALARKAGGPSAPFAGPEFGAAWWSVFGASRRDQALEILAVEDEGELIGVAPLLRGDGAVSWAGDHEISDYLGAVAEPSCEADVAAQLFEHLDETGADRAEFRGLDPARKALAERIEAEAAERGWSAESLHEAVCPVIDVGAGWEPYLDGLSGRARRETRRKLRGMRRLKGAVSFEAIERRGDALEQMPAFLRMMAESRDDKAEFLNPLMECFFLRLADAMAESGRLRLYLLRVSGEPAAMVMCFVSGGDLLLYNSGFDPGFREMNAGLASKVLCIRDAAERGMSRVNFLRGDEPYKFELGGVGEAVRQLELRRNGS